MKLTHSKAAGAAGGHTQHAPMRHFSKLAGTALLGALTFAPMALPVNAAAQDAKPVAAASVPDSMKSSVKDSVPAAAKAAPDTAKAASEAKIITEADGTILVVPARTGKTTREAAWKRLFARLGDDRYYYFSVRLGTGFDFLPAIITGARNAPLALRNVPVHPDDITKCGADSSWSQPIGDRMASSIEPGDAGSFLDLNVGPTLIMSDGRLWVEFGLGTALYDVNEGAEGVLCNERNYLSGDLPTSGDSTGYSRGYGTALTWYGIRPWPDLIPYIYAEITSVTPNQMFGISAGYKACWERITGVDGWDRYDDYAVWKTVNLMDMFVGMPYLRGNVMLCDNKESRDKGFIRISTYVGMQHIIGKLVSDEAKGIGFSFHNPAFVCGFSAQFVGMGWRQAL